MSNIVSLFPEYRGYCIDTSALIDLYEYYPRDVFLKVWEKIENLINRQEFIAPKCVLRELSMIEDRLLIWAKGKRIRKMFKESDRKIIKLVSDIMQKFPTLIDSNSLTEEADPYVIALAINRGCTVISSEKSKLKGGRCAIPDVCKEYKISCLSLVELFRNQSWQF